MPKNFITLLTLTLITIVAFVVVVLVQTAFKSTIPTTTQNQLEPINPTIDLSLIEELERAATASNNLKPANDN